MMYKELAPKNLKKTIHDFSFKLYLKTPTKFEKYFLTNHFHFPYSSHSCVGLLHGCLT